MLIVVCEVLFWVFLLSGLAARYLLRRPRLGAILLLLSPVADVVLLAAVLVDLSRGATATLVHVIAAVYLGVTLGWGHRLVQWADGWAAHRLDGAPRPSRPPSRGPERAARERAEWLRHLRAVVVGAGVMLTAYAIAGPTRGEAMLASARLWGVIFAIDTVWSWSYSVWPQKEQRPGSGR